jgi:hypothetical protein
VIEKKREAPGGNPGKSRGGQVGQDGNPGIHWQLG